MPDDFRFAVKVPKEITHVQKLIDCGESVNRFLLECGHLGEKLGPLLVQLPPSLALDQPVARTFFALLRERVAGPVVCEPRHPTWFDAEGDDLLRELRIARVAADPARVPEAGTPGGWSGLVYYRLHGSPRTYFSPYPAEYLDALCSRLEAPAGTGVPAWCIFDNTASGAAAGDALRVMRGTSRRRRVAGHLARRARHP